MKRWTLVVLTFASLAVLLVLVYPVPALAWVFAPAVMAFPVALMALAIGSERGRGGRLAVRLWILLAMLEGGALGVLAFSGSRATGLAGWPLSLHFLLLLIWLGPLLLTTLSYAATFSELGIDDALVERLERMREERGRE